VTTDSKEQMSAERTALEDHVRCASADPQEKTSLLDLMGFSHNEGEENV